MMLAAGAALTLAGAETDYPSRNIDFIIPKAPGGGFDALVRLISPGLEKHLPHKTNVVPDNIPAGGGGKGITQLYRSRPDGYTLGAVDMPGTYILQARQQGAGFDLNRLTWLSTLAKPEFMCLAVGAKSSLRAFDDLKKLSASRAVKFTSSGPEGTAYAATLVATAMLGIKTQLITGYKGSTDYVVGAIRGDSDAVVAPVSAVRPLLKSDSLRVLATFESHSTFSGVPDAAALGKPELSQILLERMVAAPPAVPAALRKILSSALIQAMSEPQAVTMSKKLDVEMASSTPEQAEARIRASSAFFDQWKKYFLA
jgi:tripartite-type tricarboxylate transporter receptor subunit TctC